MTSFLITARDKQKRIDYAKAFCAKRHIDPFDISVIEKETSVKQNIQSLGIDDVKQIKKTIFLKPFKGSLKAVIIEDAQLLTVEAQNALLKVLEEPPDHTLLILAANSKEALLPTILSRCQILSLEEEQIKLTTREQNDIAAFIQSLETMPAGERLKKAESLAKDKDKALAWIEKVIIVFREEMIKTQSSEFVAILRKLQTLHTLLKTTNVNPRFAIENTLLNL